MSPELHRLQRWFWGQLQPGAPREPGVVQGSHALPARARIAIYAQMYQDRLMQALADEFPLLVAALGPVRFGRLARAYLTRYPSVRPTIQHVGERLPRYLAAELRAGALQRFPYAAALARLEVCCSTVYVALDGGALLTAEDLRAVPPHAWPALTFRVTPSLRMLKLGFTFPAGARPVRGAGRLRVWRRGFEVLQAQLSPLEWRTLRAVQLGKPFAEVCLAAGTALRAATFLATWMEEGVLLRPSPTPSPGR